MSLSFDTLAALSQVPALGFRAVQVNLQQGELGYGFTQKVNFGFYADLARELSLRRLQVVSVHALFLDGSQVFSARVRCDLMAAQIEIAHTLGAPVLTVHPSNLFASEEALLSYADDPHANVPLVLGMADVLPKLKDSNVLLALENIKYWESIRGTNDAEFMARLVEALDCHVAFDVRRSLRRQPLERWVELLGKRVVELHLHDEKDGSEHHPPLAHDWRDMVPTLKQTPAQACILETAAAPGHGAIKMSRDYITRLWEA